jgi:hypothetical protein
VVEEPDAEADNEMVPRCFGEPMSNNILARLRMGMPPRGSTASVASAGGGSEEAFEGFGNLSEKKAATSQKNLMSEREKEDLVAVMTASPVHVAPTAQLFKDLFEAPSGSDVEGSGVCTDHYEDIKVREDRVLHSVNFNWEDHAVVMLFQTQATGEAVEALG